MDLSTVFIGEFSHPMYKKKVEIGKLTVYFVNYQEATRLNKMILLASTPNIKKTNDTIVRFYINLYYRESLTSLVIIDKVYGEFSHFDFFLVHWMGKLTDKYGRNPKNPGLQSRNFLDL